MNPLQVAQDHRNEILWWEIAAILHDVGKLSSAFHHYRQRWHTMSDGWSKRDPHDNDWLHRPEETLLPPQLRDFFRQALVPVPVETNSILSIEQAVHGHNKGERNKRLIRILDIADGMDSRYDRNSPLISNEQTVFGSASSPALFRSNVFGQEREVDPKSLDEERARLYRDLWALFKTYARPGAPPLQLSDYFKIKRTIERYFENAMSDTTRPDNDTSLWEHTYSVATLSKAFHLEDILGNRIGTLDSPFPRPFQLIGVGFDTHRFASFGQRIGDVTGRYEVISRIFDRIRELFEFTYALGNCIYRDNQFQIFLTPAAIRFEVEDVVTAIALNESKGEILPALAFLDDQTSTTCIVELIERLRAMCLVPQTAGAVHLAASIRQTWTAKGAPIHASICPICRLRPERRENGVCDVCDERRTRITPPRSRGELAETPFLSEIADSNGRVALIVARFGLRDWLSGQFIRTNFVTETEGIARMPDALRHTEELKAADAQPFADWLQAHPLRNWQQMLDCLRNARRNPGPADYAAALFARGIVGDPIRLNQNTGSPFTDKAWQQDLAQARAEHSYSNSFLDEDELLLNAICGKTPTPSTVFDVWNSTREFFTEISSPQWLNLPPESRFFFRVPKRLKLSRNQTVLLNETEFLHTDEDGDSLLWCLDPKADRQQFQNRRVLLSCPETSQPAQELQLPSALTQERSYYPFRVIANSPDVLLLLVPAACAPRITTRIYRRYIEHFGKAYGRLPLAIGNVFFPSYLPMFSVLDTAWRLVENFRHLQQSPHWLLSRLPAGLPDSDDFHSWAVVPDGAPGIPSAFKTVGGWVARFRDLKDKDVLIRPNLYDAVVLAGSADRVGVTVPAGRPYNPAPTARKVSLWESGWVNHLLNRRASQPVGLTRLEDLDCMLQIWSDLKENHASDSAVRNFEYLLASRLDAWKDCDPVSARQTAESLAASMGPHHLGEAWPAISRQPLDLVLKSLQLHLRVAKSRLRSDKNVHDC